MRCLWALTFVRPPECGQGEKLLNDRRIRYRIWAILVEAKISIYFCTFLFLTGAAIGYSRPAFFMGLLGALHGMAERLRESSAPVIIITIFFQNASSAFLAIWLGLIVGIVPFIGAVANGILLGVVVALVDNGMAMAIGVLPHGIFELPAIFIAWGLGFWRGMWPFHENRKEVYNDRARKSYFVFFTLIIPLLLIAAVIEGFAIAMLIKST
jgi:stage II sporulation protein M